MSDDNLKENETESDDDLLEFVSSKLYESICDLHESLRAGVGEEQARDIVINALSVNLGHIIGQFDPKSQRKYSNITRKTIKEHTLLGTIEKDKHVHGRIGRA